MIPMADNLNHSSVDVTNEFISLHLHPKGPASPEYFRVSKFFNDYSAIAAAKNIPSQPFKGRFNRAVYEAN
jgi:hypothetical protein